MTSAAELDLDLTRPGAPPASGPGEGSALEALCTSDPVFAARYEGWSELGRGGWGYVVRTRLRGLGVAVAVKVLCHMGQDERRRLNAEAQALMSVVHPCVVRTFAVFERGPLAWIEMELVEGRTLEDELRARAARGESWSLGEALQIGACLAEGLAAVHAAGFVHRDVKPQNVLLPRAGRPAAKLTDFGIARSLDATQILNEPLSGSPLYVCPEALLGRSVGVEGDVYGLALTLYQLFSGGIYPFALSRGATLGEALECHRRKAPLPLRALGLDLPEAVVDVVQFGLDKNPRHRPSAAEVGCVLRAVQGGDETAGTGGPGRRRGRQRRLGWILVLGMGFVLGAAGVVAALWALSG